jgi:hypothetical protein
MTVVYAWVVLPESSGNFDVCMSCWQRYFIRIFAELVLLSRLLTNPVRVVIVCFKLEGRNAVKNIEMANTGVLPFVRGVDFTSNDFSVSVS